MTALWLVAAGAAVGAPTRYLIDRLARTRTVGEFPWGTLVANVLACLVLGVIIGAALPPWAVTLLGTGFCGSLSTYSTFSHDTLRLTRSRGWPLALINVVVSLTAGFGALLLGVLLGGEHVILP